MTAELLGVSSTTEFRRVLGHFCTGVTVITTQDEAGPAGFTCQSFAALSLTPPLVSFSVSRDSTTWPRIRSAGTFAVNVLAADQQQLCLRFAAGGTDKFAGAHWEPAPFTGAPLLDGTVAWVDCAVAAVHPGGDHWIVLGEVRALHAPEAAPGALLFSRGSFHRSHTAFAD
jgi:3-hydroxy-9,10-secoandrosta-1,3,5(10)-triene-9,17-dione monooxygenase reductase component